MLATFLLSVAAAAARAAEPPPGFVPLFNGKDLNGWKADDEARRHWTVRTLGQNLLACSCDVLCQL